MKKIVGIYSTKYPIENFKIRITYQELWIKKGHFFNKKSNAAQQNRHEIESITLSWQEKLFSQAELDKLSILANCQTDAEKSYYKTIHSEDFVRRSPNLFTEISDDNELLKSSDNEVEQMRIILVVTGNTNNVLCEITYNKKTGSFIIRPDFNDIESNPYTVQLRSKKFHYELKNVSKRKVLPENDGLNIISPLIRQNKQLLRNKKSPKYHLLFQIDYASSFHHDNCHIFYEVILPNDCNLIEGSTTQGSTHCSQRNQRNNRFHYGHPVEIVVQFREHHSSVEEAALSLVFHVISTDSWMRQRSEGVAVMRIPLRVCSLRQSLQCFDPWSSVNSFGDRMRQFFIGGILMIDLKELAVSFNRFGLQAKSTGNIKLSANVLIENTD